MSTMNWIERTLTGDTNAFKLIFDQYKNLVFRTAYLILENTNEAEDALQETFVKVYRSLGTYQATKGAFTTWLYRITVNVCLNRRRKLFRSKEVTEIFSESQSDGHTSLEDKFSDKQILQNALNRLSNKIRVVVLLRFYLDLSYSEIAQILNIPLGTVKSRLNTGLKEMQKIVKMENLRVFQSREVSE